jgi:polyphosphate kinase 2 (PPK2 family)
VEIFDRSWYGRVLVERVEGLCSNEEWQRAYREINEMEAHLSDYGTVVIKFWLHIDAETQKERFRSHGKIQPAQAVEDH